MATRNSGHWWSHFDRKIDERVSQAVCRTKMTINTSGKDLEWPGNWGGGECTPCDSDPRNAVENWKGENTDNNTMGASCSTAEINHTPEVRMVSAAVRAVYATAPAQEHIARMLQRAEKPPGNHAVRVFDV